MTTDTEELKEIIRELLYIIGASDFGWSISIPSELSKKIKTALKDEE